MGRTRARALLAVVAGLLVAVAATALIWEFLRDPQPEIDPGGLVITDVVVRDARGEYRQTTLAADHLLEALAVADISDPGSVLTADVRGSLARWLAEWLGTQVVDSIALESSIDDPEWQTWRASAEEWLVPERARDVLMRVPYSHGGIGRPLLAITGDPFGVPLRLVRDGGARFTSAAVTIDRVRAAVIGGTSVLDVEGVVRYRARMDDEALVTLLQSSAALGFPVTFNVESEELRDGEAADVLLQLDFAVTLHDSSTQWYVYSISRDTQVSYTWE